MNFQRDHRRDEPEINLIPLIDVLLVILIFLMVTTTYARFSELKINLPTSGAEQTPNKPKQIEVTVDASGNYQINDALLTQASPTTLATALKQAAGNDNDPVLVINADAKATHQSVINVMEAARQLGMSRITFATQTAQ
ncbi:MAG: ExbD/TolR family protein [Thiobacillus sp.]